MFRSVQGNSLKYCLLSVTRLRLKTFSLFSHREQPIESPYIFIFNTNNIYTNSARSLEVKPQLEIKRSSVDSRIVLWLRKMEIPFPSGKTIDPTSNKINLSKDKLLCLDLILQNYWAVQKTVRAKKSKNIPPGIIKSSTVLIKKKGYWDELWRLLQFNKLAFPNYHETPCGLSPRASTFDVRPVLKCPWYWWQMNSLPWHSVVIKLCSICSLQKEVWPSKVNIVFRYSGLQING